MECAWERHTIHEARGCGILLKRSWKGSYPASRRSANSNSLDTMSESEHSAGALDSMAGEGPSEPSGAGPQSPVEGYEIVGENAPAPWPLPGQSSPHITNATPTTTGASRKQPSSGSTQKKLFNYPETPGTGACVDPLWPNSTSGLCVSV